MKNMDFLYSMRQIIREYEALSKKIYIYIAMLLIGASNGTLANQVDIIRGGSSIQTYSTIQAAVSASQDGDTVDVGPGTYIEQVTITTAITLQGAGEGSTTIQSPASASLAITGGNWKNLKNQNVYALIGIKKSTGQVTVKNITVDGDDQGTAIDTDNNDFQGIGAYDSNVTVDSVTVTNVRAVSPTSYAPEYPNEPSGMNHNEGIFAESALGAGAHTLTVRNSTIADSQKTWILAWGPTLVVDIHDNLLQGYGQTLHSSGNSIQIASSDRTGLGGANGDRRGTTGSVYNNQILGFGQVIPPPPPTGYNNTTHQYDGDYNIATRDYNNNSYLNLGQGGPSGVFLYQAGNGVQIYGNTITGPGVFTWLNSMTSNVGGGYGNVGVSIHNSPNPVVTNNTINGFDGGIYEESAVPASNMTVSNNMLSNNGFDVWTATGNDPITLGSNDETVAFYQSGNGVDTITGFGLDDKIYVVGFDTSSVNGQIGTIPIQMKDTDNVYQIIGYTDAHPVVNFTGGSVTYGNGSNVAANSVQLLYAGGITSLYINGFSSAGPAQLIVNLTGEYKPINFILSESTISFALETPTLSVTNSPQTYTGSAIAATVSCSSDGAVSNIKYNGSTTVPTDAGTYAVTANCAANGNYSALTDASAGNLVISTAAPTLSVTNTPTYTGNPIAAVVSCQGGGTVSNVLYNGSSTVPTDAGSYVITADCAASSNYSAVTGASAGNFVISAAAPTLSVTNSPQTYTGSAIAATVSCSSDGAVSNIKYNGSTTVPTDAGTYAVTANCAANGNYSALTDASAGNFVINQASQTLTLSPSSATVDAGIDQSLALSGALGTGQVTYALISAGGITCLKTSESNTGVTVTGTNGAGTCSVTASIAADTNYAAATSNQSVISVNLAPQTGFTLNLSSTTVTTNTPVNLSTTGGQGNGDVTYTAEAQEPQSLSVESQSVKAQASSLQCNISGSVLTPTGGIGVCIVTAVKAADGNYAAATATGNVTVRAVPIPNPIPTLSEWAQLVMTLLMLVTPAWYARSMKQH